MYINLVTTENHVHVSELGRFELLVSVLDRLIASDPMYEGLLHVKTRTRPSYTVICPLSTFHVGIRLQMCSF